MMLESKHNEVLKPRRGITLVAPPFKAGDRDINHVPAQGLGDGVKTFIPSFFSPYRKALIKILCFAAHTVQARIQLSPIKSHFRLFGENG
jgi:hypothetical protein